MTVSLRQEQLKTKFHELTGNFPTSYVRSPGEHIDYSGYSVLPMAIDRDVMIALGPSEEVVVANLDDKYPTRRYTVAEMLNIDSSLHEWSNYFKCGYKGVCEVTGKTPTFTAVVSGTVPPGAGLSSSSAFVCCSALATATAQGVQMSPKELTQTAIKSEKYAGVEIGGMDQSISIMGLKNAALLIDFYPQLNATPIQLPNCVFVIANTLVTSDKHVTAPTNYNLRVVETRLASAVLAKRLGYPVVSRTLRELQELHCPGDIKQGLKVMLEAAKTLEKEWSLEQVAKELGWTVDQVESTFVTLKIKAPCFKLYARAVHVFSEALRVYEFRGSTNNIQTLGELMNQSQKSCNELFECSCPEIDELTSLARSTPGCYGSRLTGAGWGGCTVSLVSVDAVESFIDAIKTGYYFKKFPELKTSKNLENYIFASTPCQGASVL